MTVGLQLYLLIVLSGRRWKFWRIAILLYLVLYLIGTCLHQAVLLEALLKATGSMHTSIMNDIAFYRATLSLAPYLNGHACTVESLGKQDSLPTETMECCRKLHLMNSWRHLRTQCMNSQFLRVLHWCQLPCKPVNMKFCSPLRGRRRGQGGALHSYMGRESWP